MTTAGVSRIFIVLQLIAALIMLALFSFCIYIGLQSNGTQLLVQLVPEMVMIAGAVLANAVMRLKHRNQTSEVFLIPMFLLSVTLQSINLVPFVYSITGFPVLPSSIVVKMSRFFFLESAILLFFASVLNLRSSVFTKLGTYVTFSSIAILVISFFIPAGSSAAAIADIHNSSLTLIAFIITLIAVVTYLFEFIKDHENYNLKHFITMLLIAAGEFTIMLANSQLSVAAAGTILYLAGIIMLCAVSPEGY